MRAAIVDSVCGAMGTTASLTWPETPLGANTLATLLAGLTSAADWIGSMNQYFPYRARSWDLHSYFCEAQARAANALADLHWRRLPLADDCLFWHLFPGFLPNGVQETVIDLSPRLAGPSLVIIEAPTGCGKTEAALYLAEKWAQRQGQPGVYVAMPTMATSNQMHGRLARLVARIHPDAAGAPLLVHSQALWQQPPPKVMTTGEQRADDSLDAMAWFLPRKRSLLAPFGVGTVDQTFLSVLQTRHFFVRLFGLAGKTVIFDEVHAYDAYMTALFERLLAWLHGVGTSVVLLSATLPSRARARMLAAYGGAPNAVERNGPAASYPAIHWTSCGANGTVCLPIEQTRKVSLERIPLDEFALVDLLRERLAEGGCAAVICNTVGRAQSLYTTLRESTLVADDDLVLFHARYPQAWREEIEERVLDRYGKSRRRLAHERSIVVATQVIEQSLDLDFDYMVTDLAPIDLIIQRVGRLHRHPRGEAERPASLRRPRLGLVLPALRDGMPDWGGDRHVYAPYVLLRSLLALDGRDTLCLPQDTAALVAAVYDTWDTVPDGLSPAWHVALDEARQDLQAEQRHAATEAARRLVSRPGASDYLDCHNEMLDDEDPHLHQSLRALTRLSEPSLTLVCLHRTAKELVAEMPDGNPIDLERIPDDAVTRALVATSVTVGYAGLYQALVAQDPPGSWKRHPLLRYCRLAVFEEGVCRVPGSPWVLRLDRRLGLQVGREER